MVYPEFRRLGLDKLYIQLYTLYMSNFVSVSAARANLPDLVKDVNTKLDRVVITVNGKPRAALLSLEELEAIEETAEILAIPGALESIKSGVEDAKAGRLIPFEKVVGQTPSEVLKKKRV